MSNGDEAMSPAEFAKLMGAYPEPAENPLPAYGGYMDNSPANFAWVQNNDYFGAEGDWIYHDSASPSQKDAHIASMEMWATALNDDPNDEEAQEQFAYWYEVVYKNRATPYNPDYDAENQDMMCCGDKMGFYDDYFYCPVCEESIETKEFAATYHFQNRAITSVEAKDEEAAWDRFSWKDPEEDWDIVDVLDADTDLTPTNHMNNSIGQVVPITNPMELPTNLIETEAGGGPEGQITPDAFSADYENPWDVPLDKYEEVFGMTNEEILEKFPDLEVNDYKRCLMAMRKNAETFEAKQDFDSWKTGVIRMAIDNGCFTDDYAQFVAKEIGHDSKRFNAPYGGADSLMDIGKETPLADFTGKELAESSAIHGDFDQASLNYSGHQNLEVRAEMEELTESIVDVSNRFGETVGMVSVEDADDIDAYEDVEVEIQTVNGDVIERVTLSDDTSYDPYEEDYDAESKSPSIFTLGLGVVAIIFGWPYLKDMGTKVFGADNDTQDMLENDPELVENPDTGDLDPAQYEELVVESTGYAVDVIPMGLDPSFMGSRFQALPTERYVEYNDPGIGAHTDVALNRDGLFLEPEMAMVQAAEGNEVKEAQAPGQSPYMSVDGQEPKDFNYRVIKETHPISLDPAVKPFIPQSMSGYTGNANTPPSVLNKMFNIGVLGQTPLFVAGQGDMGSSHTGSRDALPNSLGIAGSVGGPLSDQVNANYTDGTNSMSLAQWAIENTVSQTSDTEAVVIDRSSGMMKRIRRV